MNHHKTFNFKQEAKTLADQMNEIEKLAIKNIPEEQRHLVPNIGKLKKALSKKDPNAALDVFNNVQAALKKVQDINNKQTKSE